jgi:hypothetical protein
MLFCYYLRICQRLRLKYVQSDLVPELKETDNKTVLLMTIRGTERKDVHRAPGDP